MTPAPPPAEAVEAAQKMVANETLWRVSGKDDGDWEMFFDKALIVARALLTAAADLAALRSELENMEKRKDDAYLERNQVVAALATLFPSGIARTNIPGWSDDWHGCVYIDLPTGQVSWHYHDSHAHLFAHLPSYAEQWDEHTTDEKYARLARLDERAKGERLREALREIASSRFGKSASQSLLQAVGAFESRLHGIARAALEEPL